MKSLVVAATVAMTLTAALWNDAQADATPQCDYSGVKVESGKIVGISRSVGFVIGVRWGEIGVEMADGRRFEYKARGIKGMEIGASEIRVSGSVFNLNDPSDFEGTFTGFTGGITALDQGAGFAHYQNENCVIVQVKRDESMGLQASAPMLGGFEVTAK